MRSRRLGIGGVLAATLALTPAAASAQHLDVLLGRQSAQGPRTVIAGFDFEAPESIVQTRVFSRSLAFDAPVRIGSDPGFVALSANLPASWTPLPANAPVEFEILWERTLGWNLAWWSGLGAPDFGPPPDGEIFVLDQNGCVSCAQASADGSEVDVPGFALGTTDGGGGLHRHHDYFLLGDGLLSDVPTPGVYLVALRARAGTLDWSPPFFLVFGAGVSAAQLDSAHAWVESALVRSGCSDGTDNDGDGTVDFAGGPDGEPPDPGCTSANDASERAASSCGLGAELALLLPLLGAWRSRKRA